MLLRDISPNSTIFRQQYKSRSQFEDGSSYVLRECRGNTAGKTSRREVGETK